MKKLTALVVSALAMIPLSRSAASAQPGIGGAGGWVAGVCSETEPVASKHQDEDIPAIACKCGGKYIDITGFITVGGVRIGVTSDGSQVDPEIPLCMGYTVYPAYDAFSPGGNTTTVPGAVFSAKYYPPVCDKSDCGRFLFITWGSADCVDGVPIEVGGYQSYIVTGQPCYTGDPELLSAPAASKSATRSL